MDKKETSGLIEEIGKNLGVFFRHLLPGVFILGMADLAHPCWFQRFNTYEWQHIAFIAVIALAAGNIWYSFNRYGVHQLVDYCLYLANSEGPVKSDRGQYGDDLGRYVSHSLKADIPPLVRQHIAFRASSVLLLYTVAEATLLFWFWHDPGTIFDQYPVRICIGIIAVFLVAVWQNFLTRKIDYHATNGGKAVSLA